MNIFLLILLIAIGLAVGLPLLLVLTFVISSLFINPKKKCEKPSKYFSFLYRSMHKLFLIMGNVKIVVRGREKLPKGRFLAVCNHLSNFDPIVTYYALSDLELAFISKEANFKIPIVGKVIRKLCFLPIDREDARKALITINGAAEYIKNDVVSMLVYPEGTRSKTGELLEFHDAVFKIAKKAQVPVVVMTVKNTEKIKSRYLFRRTVVYIDILETIPAETVKESKTTEIGERARKLMTENLSEN